MFREKRLLNLDANQVKTIANPLSSSEDRAGKVLNANSESAPYNDERVQAAAEETKNPIMNIVKGTRNLLANALWHWPKTGVKKVAGFTTDVATNAVAIPANLGRWVMDLVRLVPRTVLIATDYAAEKTFGNISRLCNKINGKIHDTLGTTPSFNLAAA